MRALVQRVSKGAVVIESENYPDQSMCPVGNLVYYDAGRSSQKQYEHNYARGNGSYNASRQYRKNDGSQIDTGTYYYAQLTINIGETIEIKQEDTYSNYGHSWSIKKKRWA